VGELPLQGRSGRSRGSKLTVGPNRDAQGPSTEPSRCSHAVPFTGIDYDGYFDHCWAWVDEGSDRTVSRSPSSRYTAHDSLKFGGEARAGVQA